jgi:oxygen-independent coproporphyrinogen-3 oxidase
VARDGVGVYVHVPFCQRVCPYCDFAVVGVRALPPELEGAYLDALLAELEQRRAAFEGRSLASLYLGGGTPSLLRPESVRRIVDAVFTAFPAGGPVETTLEVNPGTVERERLPGFRGAGVNRVSVGVQSFQDTTLKRLPGRGGAADAGRGPGGGLPGRLPRPGLRGAGPGPGRLPGGPGRDAGLRPRARQRL